MKATTTRHLSEMIVEVLEGAGRPLTCGSVTNALNLFGLDVRRSAVDKAIGGLRDTGRIQYQWVPLERNGIMVTGRIYFILPQQHDHGLRRVYFTKTKEDTEC